MKRTGFDERRDAEIANDYLANHLPCSFCGEPTERETLVEYGARCGPCFNAYVTRGRPNPPMPTPEQRRAIVGQLTRTLAGAGVQS